jgi:hypothetical protein
MTTPVEISWEYQLPTYISSDWVEITDIVRGTVYVRGLHGGIAGWSCPRWKFSDLVVSYKVGGLILQTADGFNIADENDVDLLWR